MADTSYKKTTKIGRYPIIFYLLFGCPTTNFESSSRGQGNWSNGNHCIYSSFDVKVTGGNKRRFMSLSPVEQRMVFELEIFQLICTHLQNDRVGVSKMI